MNEPDQQLLVWQVDTALRVATEITTAAMQASGDGINRTGAVSTTDMLANADVILRWVQMNTDPVPG
jgi:hypothetical protein